MKKPPKKEKRPHARLGFLRVEKITPQNPRKGETTGHRGVADVWEGSAENPYSFCQKKKKKKNNNQKIIIIPWGCERRSAFHVSREKLHPAWRPRKQRQMKNGKNKNWCVIWNTSDIWREKHPLLLCRTMTNVFFLHSIITPNWNPWPDPNNIQCNLSLFVINENEGSHQSSGSFLRILSGQFCSFFVTHPLHSFFSDAVKHIHFNMNVNQCRIWMTLLESAWLEEELWNMNFFFHCYFLQLQQGFFYTANLFRTIGKNLQVNHLLVPGPMFSSHSSPEA